MVSLGIAAVLSAVAIIGEDPDALTPGAPRPRRPRRWRAPPPRRRRFQPGTRGQLLGFRHAGRAPGSLAQPGPRPALLAHRRGLPALLRLGIAARAGVDRHPRLDALGG